MRVSNRVLFAAIGLFVAVSTTVVDAQTQHLLCDPQTSGGLLISVAAEAKNVVEQLLTEQQLSAESIGRLHATSGQHSRFTLTSQVW